MNRRRKTSVKEYVIAGVLAAVLLGLLIQVWSIGQKEEIARHASNDAKRQLVTLEARKAALAANLDELNTPRGKEATLRQTYGVAKPGEEVIIVVPPTDTGVASSTPWWKSVLKFFGF